MTTYIVDITTALSGRQVEVNAENWMEAYKYVRDNLLDKIVKLESILQIRDKVFGRFYYIRGYNEIDLNFL